MIGVLKFDYTFNGSKYIVNAFDFTAYDTLDKLNKWLESFGIRR